MTENEAKEIVKKLRNKAELFKNSGFAVDGIVKSFEDSANAIETLSEEIQQYRAIGTVEDIRNTHLLCEVFSNTVRDYTTIGTIDEFKAYKQGNCTNDCKHYDSAIEYVRNKAIDEFAHQFKENLNQEFPRNYESTRPYFSLENARLSVDDIAEQMKAGGKDA